MRTLQFSILICLFLACGCAEKPLPIEVPPPVDETVRLPLVPKKVGLQIPDRLMTPDQTAIAKVIDSERDLLKSSLAEMPITAQPSALLTVLDKYISAIRAEDLSQCPAEFAEDYRKYVESWRGVRDAVYRLPDSYQGNKFLKHFQALFSGSESAEAALGGEAKEAVLLLLYAQRRCYLTARGYGLVEVE